MAGAMKFRVLALYPEVGRDIGGEQCTGTMAPAKASAPVIIKCFCD